ncbi:MAG: AAA family ATPase [Acidiferrobacterales bacterium]|nr:AAA family ATPase [Acidiferrobacterales bacterium]
MKQTKLEPAQLYTACDPAQFKFKSTAELPDQEEVIGQGRAVDAIRFGIGIEQEGFNLFALGPSRSGKQTVVTRFIERQAAEQPEPPDWCYVDNFSDAHKPVALSLPTGMGERFQQGMAQLVQELRTAVPEALESEEYRARLQEIEETLNEKQEQAFEKLHEEANAHGIAMLRTPTGFAFAPTKKGEIIKPDEYKNLSDDERKDIEVAVDALQVQLERLIQEIPKWRRQTQEEVKQLNRDVIMSAVGQLIDEMRKQYATLPDVLTYLDEVQQDVIDHADQFRQGEEGMQLLPGLMLPGAERQTSFLNRYSVNVVVDHGESTGAPVVYLDNPTYPNLVGRVEHQAQMGALVTDFTMIKAGALHQANGGYLLLDARKVLMQPYAWEGLKRVLQSHEIRIESLGQMLSLISTVSLEPEAIPLDVKVVLLGERYLYYLLCEYDPEFSELFKVAADFDDMVDRSDDNNQNYARFLGTLARQDKLRALDAGAVARIIDHSARMVEDAEKLSSRFGKIADYLREADYWAGQANRELITAEDVEQAIEAHDRRQSRIRERLREETQRGTLMISTEGEEVGQINGLSVMQLGDYAFGHPSRITARVRLGKGEVVDIEREIELGGPIHSKGVLILSGFLSGRYCPDQPLSLSASLVFEQTYGGVEGDSASSAELYALLSALSGIPLKQSFAVTGSVNQLGKIQAIGGVNEKIEGFFEVCRNHGLTGEQGVLIPGANVRHLMLRKDVVDAVDQGKFHIHAVDTIDEGIEILTGVPAGERDNKGDYPPESLNYSVEQKLAVMAEHAHEHEEKEND